jgi:diaminopimelate epimerase
LGNDYLVLMSGEPMSPEGARALCDRHRGPGGDGVLQALPPTAGADVDLCIWNPDGSIAEKSGNGLRIFARWLVEERGAPTDFSVDTGHDIVQCAVGPRLISVQMGRASLAPADVPTTGTGPWIGHSLVVEGTALEVVAVGVGNPHCVVFVDRPFDQLPWRSWGRAIEVHPGFPNRTNVQFAQWIEGALHIRIWERGAGETSASGSSSCAVAAAAVVTGRLEAGVHGVCMPGGVLSVEVGPDLDLTLVGPVEVVGRFSLDPRWFGGAAPA